MHLRTVLHHVLWGQGLFASNTGLHIETVYTSLGTFSNNAYTTYPTLVAKSITRFVCVYASSYIWGSFPGRRASYITTYALREGGPKLVYTFSIWKPIVRAYSYACRKVLFVPPWCITLYAWINLVEYLWPGRISMTGLVLIVPGAFLSMNWLPMFTQQIYTRGTQTMTDSFDGPHVTITHGTSVL